MTWIRWDPPSDWLNTSYPGHHQCLYENQLRWSKTFKHSSRRNREPNHRACISWTAEWWACFFTANSKTNIKFNFTVVNYSESILVNINMLSKPVCRPDKKVTECECICDVSADEKSSELLKVSFKIHLKDWFIQNPQSGLDLEIF